MKPWLDTARPCAPAATAFGLITLTFGGIFLVLGDAWTKAFPVLGVFFLSLTMFFLILGGCVHATMLHRVNQHPQRLRTFPTMFGDAHAFSVMAEYQRLFPEERLHVFSLLLGACGLGSAALGIGLLIAAAR